MELKLKRSSFQKSFFLFLHCIASEIIIPTPQFLERLAQLNYITKLIVTFILKTNLRGFEILCISKLDWTLIKTKHC